MPNLPNTIEKNKRHSIKKVIVACNKFKVNTIVTENHNVYKYRSILQDSAKKVGIILSKKKLQNLTGRNVSASRAVSPLPIS